MSRAPVTQREGESASRGGEVLTGETGEPVCAAGRSSFSLEQWG